jgi:hypothetical protein
LAHVDPEKFAHIGELLDTWGHRCMAQELPSEDDCDEHIRTVGISLMIEDEEDPLVFAFCLKHMSDFLERVVYGRRIAGEVPEDDDGDEA